MQTLTDFADQAPLESREQTDEWFGDPRERDSKHPDADRRDNEDEPDD